ncbi:MAG: pyruvate dehydrogenase complex dihydrolipoamide acetyltransferase [Flavisolibacter sp.]
MAEVILMPRLSDTMTEGVIAAWHKKVGDKVQKGDLLAEIETDKATMDLESYKDGTLLHLGGEKGAKINVDDLLAIVGEPGEDISQYVNKGGAQPQAAPKKEENAPAAESKPEPKQEAAPAQSGGMDVSKMEEVVLMPRLSDTMTEGVIAAWHKKVGDDVKKGDVLADIETDKATMELESYKNGKLLYQGAKDGEKIAVNDLLCIIGEEGKVDVNAIVEAAKSGGGAQTTESKEAAPQEQGKPAPSETQQETVNNQQETTDEGGRIKASPLAKKLAKEKGIDIAQVKGSGDNGRIVKSDIDNYKAQPQTAAAPAQGQQPAMAAISGEEGYQDTNVSQMRKVIARRLAESKFAAPHFYLTMEINMDNAMQARTQMNEVSEVKISFNDMIVKATAAALRKHPAVNSSWMSGKDGEFIRTYSHIHVGVAVAIDEGLIVPVIRFADQKSLSQIAAETKELAGKARNKKLQPNEFTGNTFTISNLGMMDIEEFTAIINPPDSAIMAVGRIKEVVVKKGEGFGVTNVMKITLSCDHRSVDGAVGAAFLQTFKKYMENPVTMLV